MEEKKELQKQDVRVVEIELERLRGFVNHPFKVQADSQMIELQESIKKYGILNPLIVRPRQDGTYEIISGHRRKFAAEKIGYRKVPVIIRVLKDDEAVVSMVDSNLQWEMISPSEKAFAYKMKYGSRMKRQLITGSVMGMAIHFRYHVRLCMTGISLDCFNISATKFQLVGDTGMTQAVKHYILIEFNHQHCAGRA